jgi:hypothetical protein
MQQKGEKMLVRNRQRILLMVAALILMSNTTARSQGSSGAPSSPFSTRPAPETRQFDFWLGEWDLSWPASQSGSTPGQPGHGTNTITAILDSAVIQENFVDHAPNGLRGMSVSVYSAKTGKWQQTWVDNQGGYLDFTGEYSDGKMILSRKATTKDGKEIMQRMVWHNISHDQLDWNWEASQDGGKTWNVNWPIHYARKK